MRQGLVCPSCGREVEKPRNPLPTVDVVVELLDGPGRRGIVLIQRKNPPLGWALPGGFVDWGESAPGAAVREMREETGLEVELRALLGVYSRPDRDLRFHSITTVYCAQARGKPLGGDDAKMARSFALDRLPRELCFDHGKILEHYRAWRRGERRAGDLGE